MPRPGPRGHLPAPSDARGAHSAASHQRLHPMTRAQRKRYHLEVPAAAKRGSWAVCVLIFFIFLDIAAGRDLPSCQCQCSAVRPLLFRLCIFCGGAVAALLSDTVDAPRRSDAGTAALAMSTRTRRGVRAGRKHRSAGKRAASALAAAAAAAASAERPSLSSSFASLGLRWLARPCEGLLPCILRLRTLRQSASLLPVASAWRLGALMSPAKAAGDVRVRWLRPPVLVQLCAQLADVRGAAAQSALFELAAAADSVADRTAAAMEEEVPLDSVIAIEVLHAEEPAARIAAPSTLPVAVVVSELRPSALLPAPLPSALPAATPHAPPQEPPPAASAPAYSGPRTRSRAAHFSLSEAMRMLGGS